MSGKVKRIAAFFLALALTSAVCVTMYMTDNKYRAAGVQAADGLLVVREGDLERWPISHLVTGWAFYPDALLTPEDIAAGVSDDYMFYTAVGEHARFDSTGDPNDPHGFGSYFLRLSLPEKVETYALELPEIYSAYKLYIGDRLVLQMGDPEGASYAPRTQNRMVTFDAAGATTILLAVADYSHFYSGMVYPPAFGTPLAINATRGLRVGIALFVGTLALLAAALSLYFGVRMKHQNATLFSLLCVAMCAFTSYALIHSAFALPIFPWYALEMASGYLFSVLVVILHNRICDVDIYVRRASVGIASAVCAVALCYGLWSAYLTVPVMEAFSSLVFLFKAAFAAYLLFTALRALRSRKDQVAPLFYASVICATTFAWDRLLPAYEPVLSGWFTEWGSLLLVCAIGYTLWRDITTAYANNLAFSEERRFMTRQLAMQTEYARQLQKSGEANRRLTHDFRQHLRAVMGISAQVISAPETEEKQRELLGYLEQVAQNMATPHPSHAGQFCRNVAADALLQYYYATAEEGGVVADFRLLLPKALPLNDVELCTVLGNLLENAVEACRRQEHGRKYIRIATEQAERTLLILVENSCDGGYRKVDGRFLSRKQGEARLGVGLESVRNILERHDGTLDIYPMETKFRVGILLSLAD